MEFRIADTFTGSLARLAGEEQKAAKTTAFDLQLNPSLPGLQFHKLDKAKDRHFWSVRVSADVRLIVHRTDTSILFATWIITMRRISGRRRRRLETHPKTGAAQLVEIRQRVEDVVVPRYVEASKPPLFGNVADDVLLNYGVPAEWLEDVRKATEDTLLELADHLPAEAAEALLNLATGVTPKPVRPVVSDPFLHPDAQRRFRLMGNLEELQRALDYPWDKWTVFLHPDQRHLVERDYAGPARVSGSAGTGKTIVALHRAVYLARKHPESRVLLTTFSDALSNALAGKLRRLIANEPRLGERLEVHAMNAIGQRLFDLNFGRREIASRQMVRELLVEAAKTCRAIGFRRAFWWRNGKTWWMRGGWKAGRAIGTWRGWGVSSGCQRSSARTSGLSSSGSRGPVLAEPDDERRTFQCAGGEVRRGKHPPFDFAVVDEAQDMELPNLRFLAALGGGRPNSLFFAGDLGQRIFQQPFSWKALGVDLRGRSSNLKRQLPHLPPDSSAGRPLARPKGIGRGWQYGRAQRHDLGIQRGGAGDRRSEEPGGRDRGCGEMASARIADGTLPHEIGVFVAVGG